MSFAQPFRDYEILDRVGAGAMGTVFKARHKKLGRIVALKVLRPSLARDDRYVDRLRREARIVAAMNHPNIVTGYDLGEEGGYHYFVMEYVEGKSLRALLTEWGIFAEDFVLKVATQVALALDHAVQRNVIHRDIKPGNILIDESGTVKVTDLGLAKGPADMALTRDGATVGTPQYISPEQARNPQDVDIRSDLYSLGATLYHMATGQPPFQGETLAEVITQVLNEVPIAPRVINRGLSEGLALVIRKLLAKNVRLRYQTPRELLDDLERVRNEQLPDVDESRLTAGESDRQASVWLWSLGIVAAAGALAAAVWLGTQLRLSGGEAHSTDPWLAALRRELEAVPTPGQRLVRLRDAALQAPSGTGQDVELLQRQVLAAMQRSIDALVGDLGGDAAPATAAMVSDPQRWPAAAEVVQERVTRRLRDSIGMLREQLPTGVDGTGIDRIVRDIGLLIEQRDRSLGDRARQWLDNVLPARADERLRQWDFAGAERVWRDGFTGFFDGLRQPLPERLSPAQRGPLESNFELARTQGVQLVAEAEQRVGAALQREAHDGIQPLQARLAAGEPAETVAIAGKRLREQLARTYPPAGRFRPAADPWPVVNGLFRSFDRELELALADSRQRRSDVLLDLAWRAFCDGDAAAALAVLGDPGQDPPEVAPRLGAHRAALRAAATVGEAMLHALQSAPPPIAGHPRNGGVPLELRVGADLRLQAQAAVGQWRPALLTEFRFAELWQLAERSAPEAIAALPAADLQCGRLVLAMAGDDLEQLAHGLDGADSAFLRDEVWPRLLRLRGEQHGGGVDRALAFGRLRDAFERAGSQGPMRELELALASWEAGFASAATSAENSLAAAASNRIARAKVLQQRLQELRRQVPENATVDLVDDGGAVRVAVGMPAIALRGAGEGWQLHGGRLEFASASPGWNDVERHRLEIDTGLTTAAAQTIADIDFAAPAAGHGPRLWVLTFRGIGAVLAATADDRVYGAFVEGDCRRPAAVQVALQRALAGAIGPERRNAPRLLPGAIHRLTFAIDASPSGRAAATSLQFEGLVLCREQVDLDPAHGPTIVLYPLQDLAVVQVVLHALES